MQTIKTTFTLPDYLVEELSDISKETGEKKSHIVAEALSQYFDTFDIKLAIKRSEEIKTGKVKPIEFEEIKKELGL